MSEDDTSLHLAALGGAPAIGQAMLMTDGSHPLHDPQRWIEHRGTAGPEDRLEFSPGNRALFEPPAETLAKAKPIPHAAKTWSARRKFTENVMQVDPEISTAGTALAQALYNSDDVRALAQGEGIATGIGRRLAGEVPWHSAGVRNGEDPAEAGYAAASFEFSRVDAAFDKDIATGPSADMAKSAWMKMRSGSLLDQLETEALGDFVVRFASKVAWNPSPELNFPENPLAKLASVNIDTGETEVGYLMFEAGDADDETLAKRLNRVMNHNPDAVAQLMASNIVNFFESKISTGHLSAFKRGDRGNPAGPAFGSEIELDDQSLTVAYQIAHDDLGDIKGISSPGDLAALVGVAWDGTTFDETLRSMVSGEGMALTVSGPDRIDVDPRMAVGPGDFTEFSSEVEPEVTIRQEGQDMILSTNKRPADRSQMRGRWPTGVGVDGREVWGTTKARTSIDVKKDSTSLSDFSPVVFAEDPGVWTAPGNHLVVSVPDADTKEMMKVINSVGLPHRAIVGSGSEGKVGEIIFELGDEHSARTVAGSLPIGVSARAYVDAAAQAPEGWSEADEFYSVDRFGRTLVHQQGPSGQGKLATSPYSVPVFVQGDVRQAVPADPGFRASNPEATEGVLAGQIKVMGVTSLRSGNGVGLFGVEVQDLESGGWSSPPHLVISLADSVGTYDEEASPEMFGNPASTFRVRRDNRYTKVEFVASDGKYLASAVDVAEAKLWVESFGGDVKMGEWT